MSDTTVEASEIHAVDINYAADPSKLAYFIRGVPSDETMYWKHIQANNQALKQGKSWIVPTSGSRQPVVEKSVAFSPPTQFGSVSQKEKITFPFVENSTLYSSRGDSASLFYTLDIDTSTRFSDEWTIELDTSHLFRAGTAYLVHRVLRSVDQYTKKAIIIVAGVLASAIDVPKYKLTMSWQTTHIGVVEDRNDTYVLGVNFQVTASSHRLKFLPDLYEEAILADEAYTTTLSSNPVVSVGSVVPRRAGLWRRLRNAAKSKFK